MAEVSVQVSAGDVGDPRDCAGVQPMQERRKVLEAAGDRAHGEVSGRRAGQHRWLGMVELLPKVVLGGCLKPWGQRREVQAHGLLVLLEERWGQHPAVVGEHRQECRIGTRPERPVVQHQRVRMWQLVVNRDVDRVKAGHG